MKGTYYSEKTGKYTAYVKVGHVLRVAGYFDTEIEAIRTYNHYAVETRGKDAELIDTGDEMEMMQYKLRMHFVELEHKLRLIEQFIKTH